MFGEIPILCDHHNVGSNLNDKIKWDANLFGALTSPTRVSNACFAGVAVDVEEV